MDRYLMTPEGHERLKDELRRLKAERPRIVREIAAAREHGDLSENAEYHAAKDRQGLTEARILELEAKIGGAEVIDTTTLSGDRVQFGATVSIVDEDTEAESTYLIVGADDFHHLAPGAGAGRPHDRRFRGARYAGRPPRPYEITAVLYGYLQNSCAWADCFLPNLDITRTFGRTGVAA